jgi:hypothetical protein
MSAAFTCLQSVCRKEITKFVHGEEQFDKAVEASVLLEINLWKTEATG